jgi:hypothetical protein
MYEYNTTLRFYSQTHLNFSYIHDTFFPFLFLFLLIADGIFCGHVSITVL